MKKTILIIYLLMSVIAHSQVTVYLALCGNESLQHGLGNGNCEQTNLYWGAKYGVSTFFKNNGWTVQEKSLNSWPHEYKFLKGKDSFSVYVYPSTDILKAISGFLNDTTSELIVYMGHDALMDSPVELPVTYTLNQRNGVIISCFSDCYFRDYLYDGHIYPLIWTTDMVAPEGYVLSGVLSGWFNGVDGEEILKITQQRYNYYQQSSRQVFTTGFNKNNL